MYDVSGVLLDLSTSDAMSFGLVGGAPTCSGSWRAISAREVRRRLT